MSMRYTVQSRRRKGVNALEMVKWTPPRPLHRMSTQAVVCLPDSWQLPITTGKSYAQGVSPRWRNGDTVVAQWGGQWQTVGGIELSMTYCHTGCSCRRTGDILSSASCADSTRTAVCTAWICGSPVVTCG